MAPIAHLPVVACLAFALALPPAHAAASPEQANAALRPQLADLARAGFAEVVLEDAGALAPGASTAHRVYLKAGRMAGVVVSGCDDALDLDVTVHGPRGELVAGDNDESPSATLVLLAERSGMYTVTVTAWKTRARAVEAHYAVSVAHDGAP